MLPQPNHRRGGQPGNQNARKHGYYSNVLTGEDRRNLRQASEVTGLDDEIALVRARLKSIVEHDPDNLRLISEAASTLVRLMRASHRLGLHKQESFEETRLKALFRIGDEFGIDVISLIANFLGDPDKYRNLFFVKKPIVSPEK
jgi:hypothetical protein